MINVMKFFLDKHEHILERKGDRVKSFFEMIPSLSGFIRIRRNVSWFVGFYQD